MVAPDLLATMNSVRERSSLRSRARTVAGSGGARGSRPAPPLFPAMVSHPRRSLIADWVAASADQRDASRLCSLATKPSFSSRASLSSRTLLGNPDPPLPAGRLAAQHGAGDAA